MNRRTFLKIAGMGSISIAAGCTSEPDKTLYSLVHAPDDMVPGRASLYASTCRECPAGCGILAKNREGRVLKIEGNPLHPINRGTLCMRGQAAVQGVYHPDRISTPMLREKRAWKPISFSDAEDLIRARAEAAVKAGGDRVRMVTEVTGETLEGLFKASLRKWRSGGPLLFEPLAYESLRMANEAVFGIDGLPSYRLDKADVLVSFGADFLETWLSPVEYARKFKEMHALNNGRKGLFFHVAPYQPLTGVNADLWIGCHPGGETPIALGLIREALDRGRGDALRSFIRDSVRRMAAPYTREKVVALTGVSPERYDLLVDRLLAARTPLVLGTGSGAVGDNAFQTNLAVNLLNAILDFNLPLFDFVGRHRVETAAKRSEVIDFFNALETDDSRLLLMHNVNPAFSLPPGSGVERALARESLFTVVFTNFMDETAEMADLVFPVELPLETWDAYEGKTGFVSTLQPAMGRLTEAPHIGDVMLRSAFGASGEATNYKDYLYTRLIQRGQIRNEKAWVKTVQSGGFEPRISGYDREWHIPYSVTDAFHSVAGPLAKEIVLIAAPSIRFFDGRGANRPWLAEIPDPVTKVAWQTPILVHPETLAESGLRQGDLIKIQSKIGSLEAPAYESENVRPNVLVIGIGQGHTAYGRYARNVGIDPGRLLSPEPDPRFGGPRFYMHPVSIHDAGRRIEMAHTDGSRIQHGRKIALSVTLAALETGVKEEGTGLTMNTFPLTLPLPEGYDPKRDLYPPHDHDTYRWSMVVDLDRCIGCGACMAACYAENNLGVVGVERIIEGREMSWLRVERYHDPEEMERITFLPMMCQHCDNAPCESVCPVYAPHHSAEGLNNQIYNRCIGTRFCAQNCPYKVRRFNWFTWQWPAPLNLQLNPDVTVRSKGVMEKCSFCIQRIKAARNVAKNEGRTIRDGEVTPACVQTCPTGALVFGSLMDHKSRVRRMVADSRAYQVMGYLNTKPAVIYLKKVVHGI